METTSANDSTQKFADALRQIDDWIGPQGVNGAAAAVWHRGEIVAERDAGEAQPGIAVQVGTLFGLASVTKPVTAAVVMSLVEDGLLALDEPVVRFVPEFAERSDPPPEPADVDPRLDDLRPTVTVRQLLSHTSGLPEDLSPGQLRYADRPSLATMIDTMIRLPLLTRPGAELRYSNSGYALLSRIVERLTGNRFWDDVDARIFAPLALRDIVARPGPALTDRIATVADVSHAGTAIEPYNGAYWRDLGVPWGGLYGSARDLARFAAAFLPAGPRLLSRPTVHQMITDQVRGVPGGVGSLNVRWDPAFWGLGWEVKGTKRRHWTGELTSPATFCHFGAAGTLLWADPARDLALAVFANRMTYHRWPFVPARWARLSNALIAAVD